MHIIAFFFLFYFKIIQTKERSSPLEPFFSLENLFLSKFSTIHLNKEFLTNKNIVGIEDAKYFFIKIFVF